MHYIPLFCTISRYSARFRGIDIIVPFPHPVPFDHDDVGTSFCWKERILLLQSPIYWFFYRSLYYLIRCCDSLLCAVVHYNNYSSLYCAVVFCISENGLCLLLAPLLFCQNSNEIDGVIFRWQTRLSLVSTVILLIALLCPTLFHSDELYRSFLHYNGPLHTILLQQAHYIARQRSLPWEWGSYLLPCPTMMKNSIVMSEQVVMTASKLVQYEHCRNEFKKVLEPKIRFDPKGFITISVINCLVTVITLPAATVTLVCLETLLLWK